MAEIPITELTDTERIHLDKFSHAVNILFDELLSNLDENRKIKKRAALEHAGRQKKKVRSEELVLDDPLVPLQTHRRFNKVDNQEQGHILLSNLDDDRKIKKRAALDYSGRQKKKVRSAELVLDDPLVLLQTHRRFTKVDDDRIFKKRAALDYSGRQEKKIRSEELVLDDPLVLLQTHRRFTKVDNQEQYHMVDEQHSIMNAVGTIITFKEEYQSIVNAAETLLSLRK